jgi:adenosine deaminase/adenosine deaminase CECR1
LTSRADHIFRQSLSPTAKRADEIVQAIRQHEIDNYWRVAGTDGQKERFAGEAFPLARPYISNTTLWKVVKQMPKGALLHAHLSAMLPYDKIVKIIIQTEGMEISASQALDTKAAKQNATFTFAHNNGTVSTTQTRIDASDYTPNTAIPVKTAVANFEGGEAAFIEFIKSKITIPEGESIRHELGVDEIWRRFQACFGPTGSMMQYEPVVRKFYQTLFQDLASDGINWVEIRSGGSYGQLVHNGDEDIDPNLDAWWHVMVEEIETFKTTELGKSKNFLGARVIWSDTRIKNRASITKSMANQSHYHRSACSPCVI